MYKHNLLVRPLAAAESLLLYLCLSGTACGAENHTQNDFFSLAVRMCSTLFLLLAVLLVGVYIIKKTKILEKTSFAGHGNMLHTIEKMYLGPKQSIIMIRACDERMLIGLSGSSITFLTKLQNHDSEHNEPPCTPSISSCSSEKPKHAEQHAGAATNRYYNYFTRLLTESLRTRRNHPTIPSESVKTNAGAKRTLS